jgi:hypothetical protein
MAGSMDIELAQVLGNEKHATMSDRQRLGSAQARCKHYLLAACSANFS